MAAVFGDCLAQVGLEGGELAAFGGRQVRPFGHQVDQGLHLRLGVDPKTVRRWLNGRVPYPHNRAAIAEIVGADEAELWPEAGGLLAVRTRPEKLETVYPHRWTVPREGWVRLFGSAERAIDILAYSALFLAEDAGICGSSPRRDGRASPCGSRSATLTGRTLQNAVRKKELETLWPRRSAMR